WLLAYVEMFLRDADRLADCRRRVNLCPLGSGAVAGATFPLDRSAMTADLDFAASTANSIDATGDRDFVLEFVNALSLLESLMSRSAKPSRNVWRKAASFRIFRCTSCGL